MLHGVVIELLFFIVLAYSMLHVPHCVPWLLMIVLQIATACFDCGWFSDVVPVIQSLDIVAIMNVVVVMHNC